MFRKLLIAVLVLSLSGCFGGFRATRAVHHFNRAISPHKWVQEIVFLGMIIIPVYGLATLLDAIIVNSIEFWTGSNPLAHAGDQKRVDGEDGSYAVSTLKADGSVDIQLVEANGKSHFMNVVHTADKVVVRDALGDVVAISDMKLGYQQFASLGQAVY